MKRILTAAAIIISIATCVASCSHSVTPGEAASNHYGHCRDVR